MDKYDISLETPNDHVFYSAEIKKDEYFEDSIWCIIISVHTSMTAIVKQYLSILKSKRITPKKRIFLYSNTYETYQNVFKLKKYIFY